VHSLIRHPAVSGKFYPRDRDALLRDVQSLLSPAVAEPIRALGCVAPHAGYMYSGAVAGSVYAQLYVPQTCIVLCPNHTGRGHPLAITSAGEWETPLGSVPVDAALAEALKRSFPPLAEDSDAHRSEHAIEVQLPFLQACRSDVAFVPIALGTSQFEVLEKLGEALADVANAQKNRPLIIASSDMNHYESDSVTRKKDQMAIERMLALDPRGLFDVVKREQISMCGFGPAIVMLTAASRTGATSANLIQYATSGDISGNRDMVVGYAGIVVR
jgi:AmmeMemoRadiSam system protein B